MSMAGLMVLCQALKRLANGQSTQSHVCRCDISFNQSTAHKGMAIAFLVYCTFAWDHATPGILTMSDHVHASPRVVGWHWKFLPICCPIHTCTANEKRLPKGQLANPTRTTSPALAPWQAIMLQPGQPADAITCWYQAWCAQNCMWPQWQIDMKLQP